MVPDIQINKDIVNMEDKEELYPSAADIEISEIAPAFKMDKKCEDDPLAKVLIGKFAPNSAKRKIHFLLDFGLKMINEVY